jgi:uncharacterized protein YrrD
MLQVGGAIIGLAIEASDGRIGTVSDFLFDDRTWQVRWLVVDTGGWLPGRQVLVHPSSIGQTDYQRGTMPVALTKQQVKASPDILQDEPVSRQMQSRLYDYYGWDPYWGGGYLGLGSTEAALMLAPWHDAAVMRDAAVTGSLADDADPNLRSVAALKGYHIQVSDGEIGHVEDFLIDDAVWCVRYLIVDTSNWWFGQHVLVSPHAVKAINWSDRQVSLDSTRAQVKASPPWDRQVTVDQAYAARLHTHFGWPDYI